MAQVSLTDFFAAYHGCTDKARKAALEAWLCHHYQQKRPYRSTSPLPAAPSKPRTMAEISLDHFFNDVCREIENDHDLLHNAIIHFVTTSNQYPRLCRAAKAWQPSTSLHRKFKQLMLAEDLQPLAEDQLTPPVIALMKTLQDWLRTNWYQKGEIMISRRVQWVTKELTHG